MRDYAGRYSSPSASRQRVSGRRSSGAGPERTVKVVGAMAIAALILGVGSSVWFGMALQSTLHSLDKSRQEQSALQAENQQLRQKRVALLEQGKFAAKAERLGLFPPSEKHLRRP
jgi:hypothetical protein